VISLIARITGDRALAEDLAQDAFLKAYRSLSAFDTKRRLSSWLFRIAHNTAIDSLRRARTRTLGLETPASTGAEGAIDPPAPPAPDPVERQALGEALERALATLRTDYRTAISLRYEEGLAFDEIAHVMSIPEATARSHVHRARKELAAVLRAEGWE
jgi:RNA polymerase sigma-70 factor (ECF subfamily)